jgi:predicted HTH domain antitoxin
MKMLQPALKLEIALSLYEREEVSLGRAAEMAGISREQMKELLAARGIERKYPQRSQEEVDRDVELLLERR